MLAVPERIVQAPGAPVTVWKESKLFFLTFIVCLVAIVCASFYVFPRIIDGDAVGYANAVKVYQGEVEIHIPPGLAVHTLDIVTLHRILTTALGIEALRIFSETFGSVIDGWLVLDTVLFFGVSILFYLLLERFFKSPKVAFVGALFFAGNYSMVAQGLGLFMDIGGWFFYILSIFWLYAYIESGRYRDIFLSALAIAIGAFFKENAVVAIIPLSMILLYEQYRSPLIFLQRIIPLGLLIAVPTAIYHVVIFFQYGYTYAYWIRLAETFHYSSVLVEYIKSLGSLLTLLAPLSLAGAIAFLRPSEEFSVDTKRKVFVISVLVSAFPAVLWPAITQRVLFLVVPGLILLSCFFIKRYERYWWAFLPILLLYVLAGFFMDSFILDFVNLPF